MTTSMLLPVWFALLLSAQTAEVEPLVSRFVTAIAADDAASLPKSTSLAIGHATDMLEYLDRTTVHGWRIASVEQTAEATMVLVELEATATAIGNGLEVEWPRWWSLELKQHDGTLTLASAMVLERRLAGRVALAPPEEIAAALDAAIDVENFFVYLIEAATEHNDAGCRTILWALDEGRKRGLSRAETSALRRLAVLSMRKWDGVSAVPPGERAVKLAEADGRPEVLAETLFSLGVSYWAANRMDDAVATLRKSGMNAPQTADPRPAMQALYMSSNLDLRRNRLREALANAEAHRALAERYRITTTLMDSSFLFSIIHDRLGNSQISREHIERVLALARRAGDRGAESRALYNIAAEEAAAGNHVRGHYLYRQALAVNEKHTPQALDTRVVMRLTLAEIDSQEGNHAAAMAVVDDVLAWLKTDPHEDHNLFASAYSHRSRIHLREGRTEEALADARRSRTHAQTAGAMGRTVISNPHLESLTAEAHALRALSRYDAVAEVWRAAIDGVELDLNERGLDETGSAAIMRAKLMPYRELLALLADQGCARDALVVAERMRARSLRRTLRHGAVDFSAGLDAAQRKRERELEQTIAAVNRALLLGNADDAERLRRERDAARLALREFRSELTLARHIRHERPGDFDGWTPAAGPGEVVLELTVTGEALFLFVLQGTQIEVHRIQIANDELESRVNAFVSAVEQRDFAYRTAARELYDLLLTPAASQLATAKRVRIVPDGVLWRLPFHALIDRRGHHLLERMAVTYSPSLALTRGREPAPASRTLLALADPAIRTKTADATRSMYRDISLGRLPDAVVEARTIARLYRDPEVLVGAAAREAAFKEEAETYRVLHLATHSIADDGAPLYSSIVLASADGEPLEDGLLEAREIAQMKLNADLAVLSACETARGPVATGEGMIGLNWAFLSAGVPATVVSQWKVGSASTAELMIAFHRRLRAGSDPAAALRAAALGLRRDARWQHPFYWAPFVVIESP